MYALVQTHIQHSHVFHETMGKVEPSVSAMPLIVTPLILLCQYQLGNIFFTHHPWKAFDST